MDEESVFGPLTFRQTVYFAFGVGIIYFVYNNFGQNISILVSIIVAGITFALIRNAPRVVIDESYIKRKRFNCKDLEEFQGWLRRKIAMIQAQMQFRAAKGMPADPKFEKGLKMFEEALRDIK